MECRFIGTCPIAIVVIHGRAHVDGIIGLVREPRQKCSMAHQDAELQHESTHSNDKTETLTCFLQVGLGMLGVGQGQLPATMALAPALCKRLLGSLHSLDMDNPVYDRQGLCTDGRSHSGEHLQRISRGSHNRNPGAFA